MSDIKKFFELAGDKVKQDFRADWNIVKAAVEKEVFIIETATATVAETVIEKIIEKLEEVKEVVSEKKAAIVEDDAVVGFDPNYVEPPVDAPVAEEAHKAAK